jgi:hypothetical protein
MESSMSMKDDYDDEQDQAAARWHRKAEFNNIRCEICGEVITYDEREQAFETKRCIVHASMKD